MNKLSRREQILIYILVLLMVVVVAGTLRIPCYGKKYNIKTTAG
ncbi:MAG: hypothetical protein V8R63_03070 [Thomasclavelia ramosa]